MAKKTKTPEQLAFEKALKETNEKIKDLKKEQEKALLPLLLTVFKIHPELKSYGWKQYASFWCDGGPCSFSVNYDQLDLNGKDCSYGDEVPEGLDKAYDDVSELISSLDENVLEDVFGNDQHITVFANGKIKNKDYGDHD